LEKYCHQAPEVIRQNPYALIDSVKGVGFQMADRIAQRVGYKRSGAPRLRAGISYLLKNAASLEGHTCLPEDLLIRRTGRLLELSPERISDELVRMCRIGAVVNDSGMVSLKVHHDDERLIARVLRDLAAKRRDEVKPDLAGLAQDQIEALDEAVKNRVFILTGPRGRARPSRLNASLAHLEIQRSG
jgi:exodeoxyribonuclease V alpha subunit